MNYQLHKSMLFKEDRKQMRKLYLIESINTGTIWRLGESEISKFFTGRNKQFYRTFKLV